MTAPNLTSTDRLEITDPKIAALFVKDHVSSYLAQFIGAEITLKKEALQTGAKLNVMAYWAARFVNLGLIRVTRIETRNGSAIKHYRAVANEFVVPIALLEGLTTTEVLQNTMRRDYDRFSRSVSAAGIRFTPDWHIRLYRNDWGHGTPLEPAQPQNQAGITAVHARVASALRRGFLTRSFRLGLEVRMQTRFGLGAGEQIAPFLHGSGPSLNRLERCTKPGAFQKLRTGLRPVRDTAFEIHAHTVPSRA